MDEPGLPAAEVADAYRVLRRVNRQFGNLGASRRELDRLLAEEPSLRDENVVRVLDVGSGSGDIPSALGDRLARSIPGVRVTVIGLDRDAVAVALARDAGLAAVRGDALRVPLADASVDVVFAVKFAHHFTGPALARLVAEMARVARRRVVVVDIRRHWLAYYGFVAWSRVFTRNRLVRHDGPLSVLRGFTPAELIELGATVPDFEWVVRRCPGFQLILTGRRIDPRARL